MCIRYRLIILLPGSSVFGAAALAGLGSAFFAAIAQVGIRSMASSEPTTRIVFYFALISTAGAALPLSLIHISEPTRPY